MDHKLGAVAFDLDGTLYPNYRLNFRLIPFALREFPLLLAFGRARNRLRGKGCRREAPLAGEDYYDAQARLTAEYLGCKDPAGMREKLDRLIYRGWVPHFRRIRLYPHVRETLDRLRRGGLKLALLSDFPPEEKLAALGLEGIWDLVLCSEAIGALKPDPLSFDCLVRGLGMEASRILYVGNSLAYDVRGAVNAGLRAAYISPWGRLSGADVVFFDYRTLAQYVLG
jgi:putative hydrolase of the HAD superfamily